MSPSAPPSYRTITGEGRAEHLVDRSRFLGRVVRVADEIDARQVVEQQRRAHWSARHHCSAFLLGPDGALQRTNDDGEPPGSAGAPMLDVLVNAGLSDVVAVVTRYFGGVLLGTGGLVRAYREATRLALLDATVVERVMHEVCVISVDHAAVGRLQHELRSRGARILGVDYEDQARLRLAVAPVARAVTEEIVAELTSGTARVEVIGRQWVDQQVG